MTSGAEQTGSYVLGHSERELARLERQAGFFADITRDILTRAGIGHGQRVLDLGCGVGDVSSIAADLVGPSGEVVGIDASSDALAIAEARMQASGKTHTRFVTASIEDFDGYKDFDAVIGRFILVHIPDPSTLIRILVGRMRPRALLSFIEMDMGTATAIPPLPLLQRCIGQIIEVYRRAGRESEMGSKLYAAFREAGLAPSLGGLTRISDGGEQAGYDFVTESVRSLMPAMGMLGIATPEEIAIDTLRDRLAHEAAGGQHCIFYPRIVGAWAKTPG